MVETGKMNRLRIVQDMPAGLVLGDEENRVFMPRSRAPEDAREGDVLNVFVYVDNRNELVASALEPKVEVDEMASLMVTEIGDHGAFLDWGIEKDLLLPTSEQVRPLRRGDSCLVWVSRDNRNDKPIASARIERYLDRNTDHLKNGKKVKLILYGETELGYKAVINKTWPGLLFIEEVVGHVDLGDEVTGYVIRSREDGKVDLSMQPQGKEARDDMRRIIMDLLEEKDGFIPFHDKSPADLIQQQLGMSKKQFKKAIGGLYKDGEITLEKDGIRLT